MKENRFYDRIDPISNIDALSELVCREYNLGDYTKTNIIEIGYEDFNAIISTSTGKYFMKVFSNERDEKQAREVIERAYVAAQNGAQSPRVYKNGADEILTKIKIGASEFRLALMQYIDGVNFLELGRMATDEELGEIANLGSTINRIKFIPNFVYDSWAITSFAQEFQKKRASFTEAELADIESIYNQYKDSKISALPQGFIHGDITKINLMKDKDDNFWVVDFSVANYTARLIEIVVICMNFSIIPGEKSESEKRIKLAFEKWAKNVQATNAERKAFKPLFKIASALFLLNASYEAKKGNTSEENKMFMGLGRFGLQLDVDMTQEIEK